VTDPTNSAALIRTDADVSPAWLAGALGTGPIADLELAPIGTGQMSLTYRATLTYADPEQAGPASVVIKLAAADETSRSTGIALGIYEAEIRFYQEIAPRIGGPLATCHLAGFDSSEGWFTLVLEDVAPAVQGDQIAGCTVEEARVGVRELARLHAPVLGDPELERSQWLNRPSPVNQALVTQLLGGFLERYGERVSPEHQAVCRRLVESLDGWLAERPEPLGLVHGDFRLDNLLFGEPNEDRPLTVVDWQTVGWGGAMNDVSYFLGSGLSVEDRRAHERALVEEYHAMLSTLGARELPWEECWEGYRRYAFGGVLMAIVASMLVERTERGDEMFMTTLARHAQHVLDLDAIELLPAPGSVRQPALRPQPEDEGRHPPGPEQLWNESWYFDAVSPDGRLGAYVRLGLYPNLDRCWYTAFVCGPDRPTVAVIDFAAPLPSEGLLTETALLRADHLCPEPLERFRVLLEATGEAHADPARLLRGEAGDPIPVSLDLAWETAGVPYAYRVTTRYEIPCRVSGTITVAGEELTLSGAEGQRDHSWGLRDWWAMDWVWMAAHLSDGTHLHGVQVRMSEEQALGVGYVQTPGGELEELDRVEASEQVGGDGLITTARMSLHPSGLQFEFEPLAWAPLRLESDDGRVAHFPRGMGRVSCSDGRTGLAWMEWNRNQAWAG
jgi:thiamine kinase-like enzyme